MDGRLSDKSAQQTFVEWRFYQRWIYQKRKHADIWGHAGEWMGVFVVLTPAVLPNGEGSPGTGHPLCKRMGSTDLAF